MAMNKVSITKFGLQTGTTRTMYVQWDWDKPTQTEHYELVWYYRISDGLVLIGSSTTSTHLSATYTAPDDAIAVNISIRPIAKKRKVNDSDVPYWSYVPTYTDTYYFKSNPPVTPAVPEVTLEKLKLTATLSNIEPDAGGLPDSITFEVVEDNNKVFKTSNTTVRSGFSYARYSCYVNPGSEYTVRCRAVRQGLKSEWSKYSNPVSTMPTPPLGGIQTIRATSETSVYLSWYPAFVADSYDIEYATKKSYFDGSDATTIINNIETTHYEKTGLETGEEYFFRVRAVNSSGESTWTDIVSIVIGEAPSAPTTWSSSTVVVAGEPLNLYWTHNTKDNSRQTHAEIELYINGVKETHIVDDVEDEDTDENTFTVNTTDSRFAEGAKILWRVRTAGITEEYGDWSIQRTVDFYNHPTLRLNVTDVHGDNLETLTQYPFYIEGHAGPDSQKPIGYHLSITANQAYQTVDEVGNIKMVNKGQAVYSKYFDISDPLVLEFTPASVDLESNVRYTVNCTVTMNSGLTDSSECEFDVNWTDIRYEPNAEIGVDTETYTATIRPYCLDENGNLVDDVTLAVYRREYDGSFTELMSGIENGSTYITDPHPALDYARYRIVATSTTTGGIGYYDPPGYPVKGKAVIIQWDEAWSTW